ncbi:hypothetical protein D3C76_1079650 [compost metagenome]
MIGQPGALVGFDEHVLRLIGGRHHQVEADHGNIQCPRRAHRGVHQRGMQDRGDVFENPACVKIRCTTYEQMLARGQNAVEVIARGVNGAFGLMIQRDLAFAARGRLPPPTLGFDQRADGVLAIAYHFGRPTNRRGHHFKADHQDPQVEAFVEAFQQHSSVELAGRFDGLLDLFDGL